MWFWNLGVVWQSLSKQMWGKSNKRVLSICRMCLTIDGYAREISRLLCKMVVSSCFSLFLLCFLPLFGIFRIISHHAYEIYYALEKCCIGFLLSHRMFNVSSYILHGVWTNTHCIEIYQKMAKSIKPMGLLVVVIAVGTRFRFDG